MRGYIGIGARGGAELVSYFMPLTQAMNIAICDTYKDHREYYEGQINRYYKKKDKPSLECKAYVDMDELLQRKDIDAVHITMPDHWHVLAAIKTARTGKHIMLARPLGLSYLIMTVGTTFYGTKGWISLSGSSAQSNIPLINK